MSIAVTNSHTSTVINQSRPRSQHAANIICLCSKNIQVNFELKIMKSSHSTSLLPNYSPGLLVTKNENIFIYMRDRQAPERMKSLSLALEDEN